MAVSGTGTALMSVMPSWFSAGVNRTATAVFAPSLSPWTIATFSIGSSAVLSWVAMNTARPWITPGLPGVNAVSPGVRKSGLDTGFPTITGSFRR